MFKYSKPQKILEIGKTKIGGQPGENPTVLIGSIFYHGHKILLDEKTGKIDKEKAEKIINLQQEFSDKTGNPHMLDVVVSSKNAIANIFNYIFDATDETILIDSGSDEVKFAAIQYARELGLERRIIYNSLTLESKLEEFKTIKESGLESAVLLAYKSGLITSINRVNIIENLLTMAEKAGITKPLIDTYVMDVPTLSLACRSMLDLKRGFGFPCGCGAHNAMSTWVGFKKRMGKQALKPCEVTVNSMPVVLGADFLLYGPIEDCEYIFPAVCAIDASYKYLYDTKEALKL